MSKEAAKTCMRVARPVMSANMEQAHTRVIGLYRAFYRYIPYICKFLVKFYVEMLFHQSFKGTRDGEDLIRIYTPHHYLPSFINLKIQTV